MNADAHARISAVRCGGIPTDYYAVHAFIDSTKALCSDNRHRVLHTMWGVLNVVVPVFGPTLDNSDGRRVDVKDLCERDHLLVDYNKKFIPTLSDFVGAIDVEAVAGWKSRLDEFHAGIDDPEVSALLLSPLAATGRLASLLVTHNSWFLNEIVPRVFAHRSPELRDFCLSPTELFQPMRFEAWMDNGLAFPPSAERLGALTHGQPARLGCST